MSFLSRVPALRARGFRIFWIGQVASLIGTWMQNTVQPYLAYQLSGEPIYLGLIGFAGTLPTLLLSLPAGVWIERHNKRTVVLMMQAIMALQALALGVLTLTGLITIWHIVTLAVVLGVANVVEITARQVMIPELVDKPSLPNALALNAMAFNLARIIGPAIAGAFLLLIQGGGEGWAFVVNAVSYCVVIGSLLLVRPAPHPPDDTPERATALDSLRAGQHYIRTAQIVRVLILMAVVTGVFAFPLNQQIPVFARDVLGVPGEAQADVAARNSALVAAIGTGALIASVMLTLWSGLQRKGALLIAGQVALGFSAIGFGLSRTFAPALLFATVAGWGLIITNNLTNQIIQMTVPAELRSRVFSTYLLALQGFTPFGSLLIGWVTQQFGAPASAVLIGVACLLSPLLVNLVTPAVRSWRTDRESVQAGVRPPPA